MFEALVIGAMVLAAVIVLGILGSLAALVCWLLVLPFKLLGLVFRGFAVLLALPLILVAGILGVVLFGAGLVMFLVPAFPLLLLVGAIVWLARRGHHTARTV